MNNLKLYGIIINLKNRLEIEDSKGLNYSASQISKAIAKINEVNEILNRRAVKR